MARRLYLVYPALLAVIPILYRQAQNAGVVVDDTVILCAAAVVATVLVQGACYGVLRLVARRGAGAADGAADGAALLAAAFVWLFYYGPATWAQARAAGHRRWTAALLAAALGLAAAAWWVARRWVTRRGGVRHLARRATPRVRAALPAAGRFVALCAFLVAGWSAAQLATSRVRAARVVRNDAFVRELARPVPGTAAAPAGPQRDVYVVVLDEYPGASVLRELYGIDNTPFLDSLRALGFHTPASLRSNYSITLASVSSLLNFSHVAPLARDLPAGYIDYSLGTYLIEHNRTAQFLKARGYYYAFYPSAWYPPTRHSAEADFELRPPPGFDLARFVYRSDLAGSFAIETLLRRVMRFFPTYQAVRAALAESTFAGVTALAGRPSGGRPVFAFAHVLLPHGPFLVDAACRPYPRSVTLLGDAPPEDPVVRAQFAGQIACTNARVLSTVRAILARPGPRPVVVLQGDHGSQGLLPFDRPASALTQAQVRERFSPFGAYYLPDGGAAALGDTVSIVNVLRAVLRHYHGAALPPVPNAMYYSHWNAPYTFTPIDTLLLLPVVPPTRGAASATVARQPGRQSTPPALAPR